MTAAATKQTGCRGRRRNLGRHRPRYALAPLTLAAGVGMLHLEWLRPRMLAWGASGDEVARAYPGDELIPDGNGATMATTLAAPPEHLWRWLVQMGGGRAGWYSWDWVDNKGQASADSVVPEWQYLAEGQRLRGPTNWWTVEMIEPGRTLVLRSSYSLLTGRSFDPRTSRPPRAYADGSWGCHLRQSADGGTRLVVRTRGRSGPRSLTRPLGVLVFEPVHFLMQTSQFHNLRRRAGAGR
jgi:hypothetical protein